MTNQEIAKLMRRGVARHWPNERYQAKEVWVNGPKKCFAQMLVGSLGCGVRSAPFNVAASTICKAAGITANRLVAPTFSYLVALNEGGFLGDDGGYIAARPFAELVALVHAAANLLDGGEQPATGEPAEQPATDAPEMPPPNQPPPMEQPTPLPASITQALSAAPCKTKEKEFA